MNKLLKLTSVSMLAIMTATNANAAGYTCEELIEYTSCNPGYSLYTTTSDNRCPDGYTVLDTEYMTFCYIPVYSAENNYDISVEECEETCDRLYNHEEGYEEYCVNGVGYKFYDASKVCVRLEDESTDNWTDDTFIELTGSLTSTSQCNECPIGHSCTGGTAVAEVCSGETYADVTGLTACKSCRDAAGTIGVTNDMITGITGGETCKYDLKVSQNHAVIDGLSCTLGGVDDPDGTYNPNLHCDFTPSSDTVRCDAGYVMAEIPSDCYEDGDASYSCDYFPGNVSDYVNAFACTAAPLGTYSMGGWDAVACPSTGLTDINGAVVNATTLSTGSTSVTACIVGSESQFKDAAGIYRFKSNCEYKVSTFEEACTEFQKTDASVDCDVEFDIDEFYYCDYGMGRLIYDPETGGIGCHTEDGYATGCDLEDLDSIKHHCKLTNGTYDPLTTKCICPSGTEWTCDDHYVNGEEWNGLGCKSVDW